MIIKFQVQNCEKRLFAWSRLSVRPPARLEHFCSHWTDFHAKFIFEYFSKFCRENLKFIKIHEEFTLGPMRIYNNVSFIYLIMRNTSSRFVDKIKTCILYSVTFFRISCHLWDNVQKHGRARQAKDGNIIQRMRCGCR